MGEWEQKPRSRLGRALNSPLRRSLYLPEGDGNLEGSMSCCFLGAAFQVPFSNRLFWVLGKLFSKPMVISPISNDNFIRSFPIFILCIYFSCLIVLTIPDKRGIVW